MGICISIVSSFFQKKITQNFSDLLVWFSVSWDGSLHPTQLKDIGYFDGSEK